MSATPIYDINNITYNYKERFHLHIPEYTIRRGDSIGFVGPNGCGKSTLLKILAFIEPPHGGTIYYNGINAYENNKDLKKHVTILLQEPYLLKRTVFENVAYGLKVRGKKDNIRDIVNQTLEMVGLPPDNFARRPWYALSGGEAQRVALAARLALNPEVLILDEPTASVDQRSASLIKEAINTMRKKHDTTLLIASHDLVWLNSATDRIEKIYNGQLLGPAAENIIDGPWNKNMDGLWEKILSNGQKIFAAAHPDETKSLALLNPSDIMISMRRPEEISAQNILNGKVTSISAGDSDHRVTVTVNIAEMHLICMVSHHAAESLHLLPGKDVFIIFKASSLHWH